MLELRFYPYLVESKSQVFVNFIKNIIFTSKAGGLSKLCLFGTHTVLPSNLKKTVYAPANNN